MKRSLYDYCIETEQHHLLSQWDEGKNGRLKPDMLETRSRQKVWWRCEKGHSWQAALDSRVYLGRSCPYCANQAVLLGENDMTTVAPEMAKLWHPTRNGALLPSDVMAGSKKRVWWRCEKGHEWQARADAIKAGGACPYCSGRYAIPGETDLATTHPHILSYWSDKNKLRPTDVTAGATGKVWWVCEKGHEWEAAVYSVAVNGCRCPYCAGKRVIPGETDLATLRPDLTEQWYQPLNGSLTPEDVTLGSHKKVWWQCRDGHVWQAFVYARTRQKGSGCPVCAGTVNRKRRSRYAAMMQEES